MDEFGNWTLTLTEGMHPLLEDSPKTPLCFHMEGPRSDLKFGLGNNNFLFSLQDNSKMVYVQMATHDIKLLSDSDNINIMT